MEANPAEEEENRGGETKWREIEDKDKGKLIKERGEKIKTEKLRNGERENIDYG